MNAPQTTDEYVVGYADTLSPVARYAPVHRSLTAVMSEVEARNAAKDPDGVGYVALHRRVTAWERITG